MYPSVSVFAPARLHLGFVDLNGELGRRFGSLGLALDGMGWQIRIEASDAFEVAGAQAARVERCTRLLQSHLDLPSNIRIVVEHAIPQHVGLGSGTQMSLALGMAVTRHCGLALGVREIACILDRGARSGTGVGLFETGGFVVDGGRGSNQAPPHVLSCIEFPRQWRVLLILDRRARGLHGEEEIRAFQALPAFPSAMAAHLCRLVLMRLLPGLMEQDMNAFGSAIGEIQHVVGDYFAPAQHGRFASHDVAGALEWLEGLGIAGVGQSSWGPTGFAMVDSLDRAQELARVAAAKWDGALEFVVCSGRNHGATFQIASTKIESNATRNAVH